MSKYNDDWLSAINGALDKIADFADGAFDILSGESKNNTNDASKQESWSQTDRQSWSQPGQQSRSQTNQQSWSQAGQQSWSQTNQQSWSQAGQQSWSQPGQQSWSQTNQQTGQQSWSQTNQQTGQQSWSQTKTQTKQAQNKPVYIDRNKVADKIAEYKAATWKIVLKYAGSIALLPFSVATFSTGLSESVFVCAFLLTLSAIGFGASLGLCISANKSRKLKKLIKSYLPVIGDRPEASVAYLSHVLDSKPKDVKKAVKLLLSENVFPNSAYFDGKLDILVLDGYVEDRGEIEIPEVEQEPDNMPCDLHVWIKKLNALNVAILDAEVSSKLEILCEYVRRIAEYVEEHPGSEKKLRTFLNYYLPTTVKLMEAYRTIEHMGDVGSNVAETKQRIEKSMDSLITAYKQQFEAIYFAEAIDISGDIDVLETMINK